MLEKTPTPKRLELVRRTLFDRWLFDRGLTNDQAADLFGVHSLTISRWRKRFDDPDRRWPPRRMMPDVEAITGITVLDWHRPAYPTGYAPTPPQAADEGEGQ